MKAVVGTVVKTILGTVVVSIVRTVVETFVVVHIVQYVLGKLIQLLEPFYGRQLGTVENEALDGHSSFCASICTSIFHISVASVVSIVYILGTEPRLDRN